MMTKTELAMRIIYKERKLGSRWYLVNLPPGGCMEFRSDKEVYQKFKLYCTDLLKYHVYGGDAGNESFMTMQEFIEQYKRKIESQKILSACNPTESKRKARSL